MHGTIHKMNEPATPPPVRCDSPADAYAAIVEQCPGARVLVDQLLIHIASRVANIGQILLTGAGEWECAPGEEATKTAYLMTGRADMAGFVRDELRVLMGSTLGRASTQPAFENPKHWTDLVPVEVDTEEEFVAQGGERREEG